MQIKLLALVTLKILEVSKMVYSEQDLVVWTCWQEVKFYFWVFKEIFLAFVLFLNFFLFFFSFWEEEEKRRVYFNLFFSLPILLLLIVYQLQSIVSFHFHSCSFDSLIQSFCNSSIIIFRHPPILDQLNLTFLQTWASLSSIC